MPFGLYDVDGEVLELYRLHHISVIVLLAEEVECLQKAKRNLFDFYLEQGFRVIHLPIADFNIPSMEELARAVDRTIEYARAGQNIAIHCSGGTGRTGAFAACMAKKLFNLPSDQAIAWVRRYITSAIETAGQERLVMDYEAAMG